MDVDELEFELPPQLIAQHPSSERDKSRLLVVDRADGSLRHLQFDDIASLLKPSDTLVVNQTKVIKARLRGNREGGGDVEILLIRPLESGAWLAMGRPTRRLNVGTKVYLGGGGVVEVVECMDSGRLAVSVADDGVDSLLDEQGETPLPPYIRREPTAADQERYQTVYARCEGAIAAPTAGLHFTEDLLDRIRARGTTLTALTLHVGPGTFEPMRCSDPRDHALEAEFYDLDTASADLIAERRHRGGRTVAVGTTTARTLETCAAADGTLRGGRGWTDLFIYPPYHFMAVDVMITNFHLPGSTLLLLVAAFAGRDLTLETYNAAVAEGYRFYSYGDAMMIL